MPLKPQLCLYYFRTHRFGRAPQNTQTETQTETDPRTPVGPSIMVLVTPNAIQVPYATNGEMTEFLVPSETRTHEESEAQIRNLLLRPNPSVALDTCTLDVHSLDLKAMIDRLYENHPPREAKYFKRWAEQKMRIVRIKTTFHQIREFNRKFVLSILPILQVTVTTVAFFIFQCVEHSWLILQNTLNFFVQGMILGFNLIWQDPENEPERNTPLARP